MLDSILIILNFLQKKINFSIAVTLQLSNYLKVPINYFFEDFSEYLVNLEKSQEGHMNVNYNFLVKLYSELNADQKLKLNKSLQISGTGISKAV